jgi:hypothetical protein
MSSSTGGKGLFFDEPITEIEFMVAEFPFVLVYGTWNPSGLSFYY